MEHGASFGALAARWAELCDRYLPVVAEDSIWRYSRPRPNIHAMSSMTCCAFRVTIWSDRGENPQLRAPLYAQALLLALDDLLPPDDL